MNDNFSSIEKRLTKTGERIALSVSEKTEGRASLQAYLRAHTGRPAPSPFASFFAHSLRSAFALLLIVAVGGGVASAAEGALPGSLLYPVKVRVTEPARAVLARNPQDRADFEVERAHRRLEEFARVSAASNPNPGDESSEVLATSLAEHVEDARHSIAELAATGKETDALEAASDLHSVLEAHAQVLDRLDETLPNTDDAVENVLDEALTEAEELSESFEAALEEADESEVGEAIDGQEDDAERLSAALVRSIESARESLDAEDEHEVRDELTKAQTLIEAAQDAEAEGELSEALLLYTDANDTLNQLSLLMEADAELGIDVIEAEE